MPRTPSLEIFSATVSFLRACSGTAATFWFICRQDTAVSATPLSRVLYLQDGQNVFDAATAFAGVEWGVDETAQRLIRRKLIEPIIIVAVANTGPDRIHEYAPTRGVIDAKQNEKSEVAGWPASTGNF